MTEYRIMQMVSSVRKKWQETIYTGTILRLARLEFATLEKAFPDEYFELIQISHEETCLMFTSKKEAP